MTHYRHRPFFRSAACMFALVCTLVCLGLVGSVVAQDKLRIEEDWELVLGEPDANSVGPQVITTMSPNNNLNGTFFTMEVNHRSAPTWTPGGISIHRWSGDWRMGSFDRSDRTVMSTSSETVTWTQAMYFDNGRLVFKIYDGVSDTWGPFGYSGAVRLDCSWGVTHINSYSPTVSVANSGPAYAGNRVHSLKLLRVRTKLAGDIWVTDETVRVAHQLVE
jgi:hypothetical protein